MKSTPGRSTEYEMLAQDWRERAETAEAALSEALARIEAAPRVEIRTTIGLPTECRVWIGGILRFNGTSPAARGGLVSFDVPRPVPMDAPHPPTDFDG